MAGAEGVVLALIAVMVVAAAQLITHHSVGGCNLQPGDLLGTGTPMCAGCGGLQALHEVYDVLGERTVFVNAAGCMTLLAVYPFTPFRGSWLYTAMASAPAGAPWTWIAWNRP